MAGSPPNTTRKSPDAPTPRRSRTHVRQVDLMLERLWSARMLRNPHDGVRRKLQSILRKLGLEKGGHHAFRHGHVSILQAKGVPGDLVKEWVGHSSLRTTSNYTHFQDEYRQQVVNDVGILSGNRAENCSVGPNGPKFLTVAEEIKVA